jgi:hypothetical protein
VNGVVTSFNAGRGTPQDQIGGVTADPFALMSNRSTQAAVIYGPGRVC